MLTTQNISSGLRIIAFIITASLLSHVVSAQNILTNKEQNDGWELLYDGSSLSQWRNYQQQEVSEGWQAINGELRLAGKDAGDLISRKAYKNFDLRLEWNTSLGGNAGIFFLADEAPERIYYHAPEVQLLDNERHSDNKKANHLSGSLYDLIASPTAAHLPAGEWNTLRILYIDGHLNVWQNNALAVNITLGSERWDELVSTSKFVQWPGFGKNREGHLGLQDHGHEVAFRNMKIKRL